MAVVAPPTRAPRGTPPGPVVGCEPEPVETPEDACWKLVNCGSILLHEPEGEDPYTWGDCVDQLSRRTGSELDFILSCVQTSTCDELVPQYYPDTEFYGVVCFAFGRS